MNETLTRWIISLGRGGTVATVTAASVVLSLLTTSMLMRVFGHPPDFVSLLIAALVPLFVASSVSWVVVDVLFRLHQLEAEIRRVATFDTLTGVMTRHAFFSAAETAYQIAARNLTPLSAISIDIDDFKRINDSHGHAAGDRVLEAFGATLRAHARKSDVVGRIGGEEFAMILPDTGSEGALHLAGKIRSAVLESPVEAQGQRIAYTISLGLTQLDHGTPGTLETLLKGSDQALYEAKHRGKNTVAVQRPRSSLSSLAG